MSYMKAALHDRLERLAMLQREESSLVEQRDIEELERAVWELNSAARRVDELVKRIESRRNERAGRLADVSIQAGQVPF